MTLTTPWKKPTTRPPVHLVELDKAGILIKISVCKFKFVFFFSSMTKHTKVNQILPSGSCTLTAENSGEGVNKDSPKTPHALIGAP